jgi:hypothetical protein
MMVNGEIMWVDFMRGGHREEVIGGEYNIRRKVEDVAALIGSIFKHDIQKTDGPLKILLGDYATDLNNMEEILDLVTPRPQLW